MGSKDILTADVKKHPNHLLSEFLILDVDYYYTWKGVFTDDEVAEVNGMPGQLEEE